MALRWCVQVITITAPIPNTVVSASATPVMRIPPLVRTAPGTGSRTRAASGGRRRDRERDGDGRHVLARRAHPGRGGKSGGHAGRDVGRLGAGTGLGDGVGVHVRACGADIHVRGGVHGGVDVVEGGGGGGGGEAGVQDCVVAGGGAGVHDCAFPEGGGEGQEGHAGVGELIEMRGWNLEFSNDCRLGKDTCKLSSDRPWGCPLPMTGQKGMRAKANLHGANMLFSNRSVVAMRTGMLLE